VNDRGQRRQQLLLAVKALAGNDARHGQVESVADPADGVGVVDVTLSELCGTPAVDGPSNELLGTDEKCETDCDDDSELSTQAASKILSSSFSDPRASRYGVFLFFTHS